MTKIGGSDALSKKVINVVNGTDEIARAGIEYLDETRLSVYLFPRVIGGGYSERIKTYTLLGEEEGCGWWGSSERS